MGFVNHLLNQITSIQLGVGWPVIVGEHSPLARTADSDRIGVVVLHRLDDLTGIEGDVRPERGVIVVHQEYPCPPDPLVIVFHKIQVPLIVCRAILGMVVPAKVGIFSTSFYQRTQLFLEWHVNH